MILSDWILRSEFLQTLFIFSLAFAALWSLKLFFLIRLERLAAKTKPTWDDHLVQILSSLNWPFFGASAFWLAISFGPFRTRTDFQIMLNLAYFVLAVYCLFIIQRLIGLWFEYSKEHYKKQPEQTIDPSAFRLLSLIVQAAVWLIGLILVFQNLGFNVTALIGGISVTGLAIAFALQNIFVDLFASLSIYFDKPFATGDLIAIGEDSGRVKHIGLKTTRIRMDSGEELVISNRELTTSRVHNFKTLKTRDFVLNYILDKNTSSQLLSKLPFKLAETLKDSKQIAYLESGLIEPTDRGFHYEIKLQEVAPSEKDDRVIKNQANLLILETLKSTGIKVAFN